MNMSVPCYGMSVYEWIFCYEDGEFQPRLKRNYPWKIKEKEVYVEKKRLEKWVLKFAHKYLSNRINLEDLFDITLDNSTELGLWYTTIKLYEILFGKFPIRDKYSEKLLDNILNRTDLSLVERVLYGVSYLFAYNRLKILKGKLLWKKKIYITD